MGPGSTHIGMLRALYSMENASVCLVCLANVKWHNPWVLKDRWNVCSVEAELFALHDGTFFSALFVHFKKAEVAHGRMYIHKTNPGAIPSNGPVPGFKTNCYLHIIKLRRREWKIFPFFSILHFFSPCCQWLLSLYSAP